MEKKEVEVDEYTAKMLESEDPADRLTGRIRTELLQMGVDPDTAEVTDSHWGEPEGAEPCMVVKTRPLDWIHGKLLPEEHKPK